MLTRFSIRLAVALVTFVIGLKLAWVVAALFGPALSGGEVKGLHAAPPAVKTRSCPTSLRGLDVPPPPPAAAEPSTSQQTRVVIRRSDGTVKVVETVTETKTRGK